jgi:aminopeptidase-like protein
MATTDDTPFPPNADAGREMYELIRELFPICRSITGDGFRQTLKIISQRIPLEVREVHTGTQVFDWTVPKEWNIRDAYVRNPRGEKIIDFQRSNLEVLNYSAPIHRTMPLTELKDHLFSLPDHPDWIPYRTAYYRENWGFCLPHFQLLALEEGDYEVSIDSSLADGSLTYGEYLLPGEREEEILISCHACHPSLANDNLSGVSLAVKLAETLGKKGCRFSYRFLFIPGTIGAIAWLCLNEPAVANIRNGLVLTGVGDSGKIIYKKSRRGDAEIDRAAVLTLRQAGAPYEVREFYPYGYDERQYCSPGFNLPVGRFSRTPYGEYPEYHTSADNLDFVKAEALAESISRVLDLVQVLEENRTYRNLYPKGEPQLGKRGLYAAPGIDELALLWVLNLSDGSNDLLTIAERSGLEFRRVARAAGQLKEKGLLQEVPGPASP